MEEFVKVGVSKFADLEKHIGHDIIVAMRNINGRPYSMVVKCAQCDTDFVELGAPPDRPAQTARMDAWLRQQGFAFKEVQVENLNGLTLTWDEGAEPHIPGVWTPLLDGKIMVNAIGRKDGQVTAWCGMKPKLWRKIMGDLA